MAVVTPLAIVPHSDSHPMGSEMHAVSRPAHRERPERGRSLWNGMPADHPGCVTNSVESLVNSGRVIPQHARPPLRDHLTLAR
jgi:hypothetical protein